MRLKDKRAVVTGAGGGMGRAVAAGFCDEGADVLVVDIDEHLAGRVADELAAAGGKASAARCDVASEADWAAVASTLADRWGGVDVLYNNAAIFLEEDGPAETTPYEVWNRIMRVNAGSVFLGSKYMVPLMRRAGGGSIINVASIRARRGASVPQDAYSAAKGAVLALTVSMAAYLAAEAIRVNAISPGTVVTPMAPIADDEAAARRLTRYPMGRFGTPSDVVGAALYLASDESAWTTGVELPVDGGTSAFYV